jgi:hypothetical protein
VKTFKLSLSLHPQNRLELFDVGLVLSPSCQAFQVCQVGNRRDPHGRFPKLEFDGARPQLLEGHGMVNEKVDRAQSTVKRA